MLDGLPKWLAWIAKTAQPQTRIDLRLHPRTLFKTPEEALNLFSYPPALSGFPHATHTENGYSTSGQLCLSLVFFCALSNAMAHLDIPHGA